jgi:prepilin-type N-terminal cleavage/methylation domain-containing protein
MKNTCSKGFTLVEVLLTILVVTVVAFCGFIVTQRVSDSSKPDTKKPSSASPQTAREAEGSDTSNQSESPAKAKSYQSQYYGLSFAIPDGWTVSETEPKNSTGPAAEIALEDKSNHGISVNVVDPNNEGGWGFLPDESTILVTYRTTVNGYTLSFVEDSRQNPAEGTTASGYLLTTNFGYGAKSYRVTSSSKEVGDVGSQEAVYKSFLESWKFSQ